MAEIYLRILMSVTWEVLTCVHSTLKHVQYIVYTSTVIMSISKREKEVKCIEKLVINANFPAKLRIY